MGFLDKVVNTLSEKFPSLIPGNLKGVAGDDIAIGGVISGSGNGKIVTGLNASDSFTKDKARKQFSVVNPRDWYQVYPYSFEIRFGKSTYTYTLPIPPESISTKMVTATEATPTLGGVIEETSETKIWMIQLTGTTGVAIGRSNSKAKDADYLADSFRDSISTTGLLSGASNDLASGLSKAANIFNTVDKLTKLGSASNPSSFINGAAGVADLAGSLSQPNLPYAASAVGKNSNGYSEIARIHKFLYMYSIMHEQNPTAASLHFSNYKDRQSFRCVLKDFSVQKSSQEPHLYRYRIVLKCWQPSGDFSGKPTSQKTAFDRYGPNGDLKNVNTLNMGNFAKMNEGWKTMKKGKLF